MIFVLKIFTLILLLQSAGFLLSVYFNRNSIADVFWGAVISIAALASTLPLVVLFLKSAPFLVFFSPAPIIMTLTVVWGLRLTWSIGRRFISHNQEDPRYAAMTQSWKRFYLRSYLQVFLLQGALMLLMLSALLTTLLFSTTPNLVFMGVGVMVWIIGFIIEVLADKQLKAFTKEPNHKGQIMQTGLWRYSRHPNYFGEVVLWWGIWLITLPSPYWYLSLITPLTITFLILKVSGVPLAEERLKKREGFEAYAKQTNKFFLWKPKA